jgi:hypothetical protein
MASELLPDSWLYILSEAKAVFLTSNIPTAFFAGALYVVFAALLGRASIKLLEEIGGDSARSNIFARFISKMSTVEIIRESGRKEIISAPLGSSSFDLSEILDRFVHSERDVLSRISRDLEGTIVAANGPGPDLIVSRGNRRIGIEVVFGVEHGLAKSAKKMLTGSIDQLVIVNLGEGHTSNREAKIIEGQTGVTMIDLKHPDDVIDAIASEISKGDSLK